MDPLLRVNVMLQSIYALFYIDIRTKDELIELLSSSKFTGFTWEQFVCYLPNMTQDISLAILN